MSWRRISKGIWFFCAAAWAALGIIHTGPTADACIITSVLCLYCWWVWPSK